MGVALVAAVAVGFALRVWAAARHGLNLDESFTAVMGRRSVGDLFAFLRAHDAHPPLDYLLRAPLARAGMGSLGLRAPSVAVSTAALGCLAWWLRDRGWFAVLAVAGMAVSGYQLAYGTEARMYALLTLLGVVAAMTTDAWLTAARGRHAVVIAVVVALAVFDHVSGLLLAAGLMTVPWVRTDRAAWSWRGAVAAPVVVFAATWGPALWEQRTHDHTPAPGTSLTAIADTVGAQVSTLAGAAGLGLLAVVAGIVALRSVAPPVFRAALATAVVPFGLAAVVGLATPVLIPRFVVAFGWVVPVALAAGIVWVARSMRWVGLVAGLVLAGTVLASTVRVLTVEWPVDRAVARLHAVARPGDVVATSPAWYAAILDWHLGVHGPPGSGRAVEVPGLDDTYGIVIGAGPPTGRLWILRPVGEGTALSGRACADPWTDGVATVDCLADRFG